MASYEKIFQRENGTEDRILVIDFTSPFSTEVESDCSFFTRNKGDKNWNMIVDTPERREKAKHMSVSEFLEKGRNPIFYHFSFAEILKATDILIEKYKGHFIK